MYKTYFIGTIMILFGIFGIMIDFYEGRPPNFEGYFQYILTGAGLLGLRIAIKEKKV